jgi:hypothetical protein
MPLVKFQGKLDPRRLRAFRMNELDKFELDGQSQRGLPLSGCRHGRSQHGHQKNDSVPSRRY